MHLDTLGCVQMHSDAFGHFWKFPEIFVFLIIFARAWTFSDVCGCVPIGLERFGGVPIHSD